MKLNFIILLSIFINIEKTFAAQIEVSCRLISFNFDATAKNEIYANSKSGVTKYTISESLLKAPASCISIDGKIYFKATDAKDSPTVAIASVGNNTTSAVIFFLPDPKQDDAIQYNTVVIPENSFPNGGAFLCNFYTSDILMTISETKHQLKPGMTKLLPLPTGLDDFNMAPVTFSFFENSNWRLAQETMLHFVPGQRYFIFTYAEGDARRPKVKTYRDVVKGNL